MLFLSTLLISLFVTIALVPIFSRLALKLNAGMDVPDERKIHTHPIPRSGGIAMALGACAATVIWAELDDFLTAYAFGCGIIVLFGVIDDFRGLGAGTKFVGQIGAALVVVFYGGVRIEKFGALLPDQVAVPAWVVIPLTLLVIVGVTNAINLSDGLDGLAGGICLMALGCVGYLAYLEDDINIALLSVALCGAIFGFLRFNTYPATLFMGDTGSQLLGFSTITLSLGLSQGNSPVTPLLPLVILGLPVLDTVAVMAGRLVHHRPLFAADKNHFHHKLIRIGLFQTEAVFAVYLAQAFMVVCAFLLRFRSEWLLLIGYLALSALVVSALTVAAHGGSKLKRDHHFIDVAVKPRLRAFRQRLLPIRLSFGVVRFGIPLLLILTCLLPAAMPRYFCALCGVAAFVLLLARLFNGALMRSVLTVVLYLLIPFLVYFSESATVLARDGVWVLLYNLLYIPLVFFVILTLRNTRRRKGFHATPMDFLTLFIALAIPLLTRDFSKDARLGIIAAKTVMLFFSFEVLIGEMRGETKPLAYTTMAALALVAVRGLI